MNVTFKAKSKLRQSVKDFEMHDAIKLPVITTLHCDMPAFRSSKRFGHYANSDLFPTMINRAVKEVCPKGYFFIDDIPDGVTINTSKFLAVVIIDVPDAV